MVISNTKREAKRKEIKFDRNQITSELTHSNRNASVEPLLRNDDGNYFKWLSVEDRKTLKTKLRPWCAELG